VKLLAGNLLTQHSRQGPTFTAALSTVENIGADGIDVVVLATTTTTPTLLNTFCSEDAKTVERMPQEVLEDSKTQSIRRDRDNTQKTIGLTTRRQLLVQGSVHV
jgi:hypothetical protein